MKKEVTPKKTLTKKEQLSKMSVKSVPALLKKACK
jgi:hypothetical protein